MGGGRRRWRWKVWKRRLEGPKMEVEILGFGMVILVANAL